LIDAYFSFQFNLAVVGLTIINELMGSREIEPTLPVRTRRCQSPA